MSWVPGNNRQQAEEAKHSGPRRCCISQRNDVICLPPGVPSSLPAQAQSSSNSPLSCFHASSIFPLCRDIPNIIKHAIIFPILRKDSFLHHAFLFPASLFLFSFAAKLLKRVTLLSPVPFLRRLLNPPHWFSPPSLHRNFSCQSYNDSLLNSVINFWFSLYLSHLLPLTPGIPPP